MFRIEYMDKKQAFAKWLEIKYIEWMRERGEVASQRAFADYLEIDPVSLSNYLNAKRRMPDEASIEKIADNLGPEIYDILGLARPDPQLQELTSIWHKLDQETKDKILQTAKSSH